MIRPRIIFTAVFAIAVGALAFMTVPKDIRHPYPIVKDANAQGRALQRRSIRRTRRQVQTQTREALRPRMVIKSGAISRARRMQLSLDGRYLSVFLTDNSIRIWDLKAGAQMVEASIRDAEVDEMLISPTGSTLGFLTPGGGLYISQIWQDSSNLQRLDSQNFSIKSAAFFGNRFNLVAGGSDGSLRVYSAAENTWSAGGKLGSAPVSAVAVDDDGRAGWAASQDGQVVRFGITAGALDLREDARWRTQISIVGALAVPGGTRAVLIGANGTATLFDTRTGTSLWQLAIGAGNPNNFSNSTANSLLVREQGNNFVRLNVQSGEISGRIKVKQKVITDLLLVHGGQRLILSGAEGKANVISAADGEYLGALIMTKVGWSVLDATGRYDGNFAAANDIAWRAGDNDYEIERFSKNYFEPGLAAKLVGVSNERLITRPKNIISEGIFVPPTITLSTPNAIDSLVEGDRMALEVEVKEHKNSDGETKVVRLYQNGKRLPTAALSTRDKQDDDTTIFNFEIEVSAGDNVLTAVAVGWGDVTRISDPLNITAAKANKTSALRISAVGINAYTNPKMRLNYAVADAKSMADVFGRSVIIERNDTIQTMSLDDAANGELLRERLEKLKGSEPKDTVILFFSGHAVAVGDNWYFLPQDLQSLTNKETIIEQGLSATELSDALVAVPAQKIVLIIDTCQSGAAIDAFSDFEQRRALLGLVENTGVHVLTATRSDQLAPEYDILGHGIFTYTLLNGLKRNSSGNLNADTDPPDGEVTVRELQAYAIKYVPQLAAVLDEKSKATKGGDDSLRERVPVLPVATSIGRDFSIF
jgi:hypothetical protein